MVDDFLVTDPQALRHLDLPPASFEIEEQLLLTQDGDRLDLALFLDPQVVGRLRQDDPMVRLPPGNLAHFCTALEGVSHFLYLTWNARFERSVSLLELELQAEVDKFIAAAFLFARQRRGRIPAGLRSWLYDGPAFDEALDEEALARYRRANYYASKYCSQLASRYLHAPRGGGMVNELRRFHRLTQGRKIRRIETPVRDHGRRAGDS